LTSFWLQLQSDPAVDIGGLLNGTDQFGRAADRSSDSQPIISGKNGINLLLAEFLHQISSTTFLKF
jgi:hypothetical protein